MLEIYCVYYNNNISNIITLDMLKFLVTNDINDINELVITHFSLDKGHYMAKSLAGLGHTIYFLTIRNNYVKNNINYISVESITKEFLDDIDYILISREALFLDIVEKIPSIYDVLLLDKKNRSKPKFIIKSDCPLWHNEKEMRRRIHRKFNINMSTPSINKWVVNHIDYICAQNDDFKRIALKKGIPSECLLISNMGIPNKYLEFSSLVNPYDVNHTYCVDHAGLMGNNRALWPLYYVKNPDKKQSCAIKKHIIIYTGRIKVDGGKILFNMKHIIDKLGDDYELHIFPGSFLIPTNDKPISHSARNAHSLETLRNTIFADSKNVFIHYPYEHEDKYKYLHFADCGIDFSDVRPHNTRGLAGHAKILEYCEVGLPVVCEDNINNLNLVKSGKNAIILPYLATDDEYAQAIKTMVTETKVDRPYCSKLTIDSENWDKKAIELLEQLSMNK